MERISIIMVFHGDSFRHRDKKQLGSSLLNSLFIYALSVCFRVRLGKL